MSPDRDHTGTRTGGRITNTGDERGYGPVEFLFRRALPGTYALKVRLSPWRQGRRFLAPVNVYLRITKNFGSKDAETRLITRRIRPGDGLVHLGDARFEARPEDVLR